MKNSEQNIKERYQNILDLLQKNSYMDISDLANTLQVSQPTIRRDVVALSNQNKIIRHFGGVKLANPVTAAEVPSSDPLLQTKMVIAQCAANLLKDGDTVFINSSATALLIYPYIINKKVVVITNNGRSLSAPRNPGTELVLTGGEVNSGKMSMIGEIALNSISNIVATKCILGVSGISIDGGFTTQVIQETPINRSMIAHCKGSVIVVADHTKIGRIHNFTSGKIEDVNVIITDSGADPNELAAFRTIGIEVIIAE